MRIENVGFFFWKYFHNDKKDLAWVKSYQTQNAVYSMGVCIMCCVCVYST